jgi:hypothetical protein
MQFDSKESTRHGFSFQDSMSSFSLPFPEFLSALEENVMNVTDTNFTEFHRFDEEFDFSEIGAKF